MPFSVKSPPSERDDAHRTLEINVREGILDKHSPLYEEPRFLLMQELNEPSLYFSILKAIAFGRTRLNDIAQETGIVDGHKVNKYISVLRDLRIVRREVPVTEDKPYKSRRGSTFWPTASSGNLVQVRLCQYELAGRRGSPLRLGGEDQARSRELHGPRLRGHLR